MTAETATGQPNWRRLIWPVLLRLAALGAVLAAAGAITFGYLGWLHWAFDSFSHFRIHFAIGLVALVPALLLLRFLPEAIFAGLLGIATVIQTTGLPIEAGARPAQAVGRIPATYSLLQLNLRYDNPERERVLSLIGELRPDIVTLNEVSAAWVGKLELLKAAYPHQLVCPPPAFTGGSAILSRRPFVSDFPPRCADRGSYGHARIDIAGTRVDIGALHLGWPWPFEQPWQVPNMEPALSELGETAILAGDFNAAPWSRTARTVSRASGARILRGLGPTWLDYALPDSLRGVIGLPIDQVLVKGGVIPISLTALDNVGSDHLPVLFDFTLLPEEGAPTVQQAALRER